MSLILFVMIGIAGVYVMDMGSKNRKILENHAQVDSYRILVDNVRAFLYSGTNCTEAFAKRNTLNLNNARFVRRVWTPEGHEPIEYQEGGITAQSNGAPIQINMPYGNFPGPIRGHGRNYPTNPFEKGFTIAGGTTIKEIKLMWNLSEVIRNNVQRDTPVSPRPPLVNAVHAYLQLVPDHPGINPNLPRNENLRIKILAYYDPVDGSLDSCFHPDGDAFFCTIGGGAYNPDSSLEDQYRCEPDDTCWVFGSGIVTSTSQCPSTNPTRYKTSQIGSLGSRLYYCDWCNRHRTPAATPVVESCASYENSFREDSGCIQNTSEGDWYNVGTSCECRDITGEFWASCNVFDGLQTATECRSR